MLGWLSERAEIALGAAGAGHCFDARGLGVRELGVEAGQSSALRPQGAEAAGIAEAHKMENPRDEEVQIVEYRPEHQPSFKRLNEEWITRWFKMEEADYKSLDHPQEYILDTGGHILIALCEGEPVGTCALIKMDAGTYELAKMSVSSQVRGKGIGFLLGQAAIEKARSLGARRLYLESNTVLEPAVRLYRKLGFQKIQGATSPYERCDIQMELILS